MALYNIAGVCVEMSPRHALTAHRAAPYRVENGTPAFAVTGKGNPFEEYAALAQSFYEQLLAFDGFLLHSSAVEKDGKTYLFSAPSGTGKSTHAAFWERELGGVVINDDKPAVRLIDGVFHACGTPFCGKHNKGVNRMVPLGAVCLLHRADKTAVRRVSAREALPWLLPQVLMPNDKERLSMLLDLVDCLLASVPVYATGVPNNADSAKEVWEYIK